MAPMGFILTMPHQNDEKRPTALKTALYQALTIYFQGKMKEDPLRDLKLVLQNFFGNGVKK